jgi:putative DNA primase/helicase
MGIVEIESTTQKKDQMGLNTIQQASGRWGEILPSFGVDRSFLTGRHTECPMCGGKDRFRFANSHKDGSLIGMWFCNQCKPEGGTGIDLLIEYTKMDFRSLANEIDKMVGNITQDKPLKRKDPRILLRRVGRGLQKIHRDNPAGRYLISRGLDKRPNDIWYHSGWYHPETEREWPCMVSVIRDKDYKAESYHMTYLNGYHKADITPAKKVLPPINTINGCGIYLGNYHDTHIVVAEGIETALAASNLFGWSPVATITAGGMAGYEPPSHVTHVVVAGDNDESYTGHAAAYALAKRLKLKGLTVGVKIPDVVGKDWLDVYNSK